MWANNFFAAHGSFALHYILSGLLEYLEFPIETTSEVSVACMLSFPYEDSITSTVSLHELHIDFLKLYISTGIATHWHIHIDTTPNKLFVLVIVIAS